MRLYLPFVILGFAGIAYVWNNPPATPAAESAADSTRHLFDWQSADDPLSTVPGDVATARDDTPLVVRDTIHGARTDITSVLDEFVRVNGATSAQPDRSDPDRSDIVTTSTLSEGASDSNEPVPFAISEPSADTGADFAPADARAAVNQPGDSAASDSDAALAPTDLTEQPTVDTATNEALPVSGKPSINEATLITSKPAANKPAAKSEATGATREPAVAANKPSVSEPRSRSELLPSGTMPDHPAVKLDSDWKVVSKSTGGLPMHTRRFGRQGPRTMIVAGLDGRDLVATHWNDGLADALALRKDLLLSTEVLIFRAGNPDGLTNRLSMNPHSVLINRNFPSRRFRRLPDKTSGPRPSSEPETQAILAAISAFQPQRLIHLTSTAGPTTVLFNRAAKDLANDLQQQFQWTTQPLDADQLPGSLEDYADGTLDIAVLSLRLHGGTEWRQSWPKHLPAVLLAIQGKTSTVAVSDEVARTTSDPIGSPVRWNEEPAPTTNRRRGYEELPRPTR